MLPNPPTDINAPHGMTTSEAARYLRIGPDRLRAMILAGELGAINVARHRCGKPRYVILPEHIREFVQRRSAVPIKPTPKPKRRPEIIDYYPDTGDQHG
jgi:excisionase family DNA binding protein